MEEYSEMTGHVQERYVSVTRMWREGDQEIQNEILPELTNELQHQKSEWLIHRENIPKIYIGLDVGRKVWTKG